MKRLTDGEIICETAPDTMEFGSNLAKILPKNSSIALIGDLGSGKTMLVKGMALGFGIDTAVTSPSFNILNIYSKNITLLHVDAYRLDGTERAAATLMLDDFLVDPYCLIVEWPERLHGFLHSCNFILSFQVEHSQRRKIAVKQMELRGA
jgi:tRNA threonylcarbamoyladenosine biosynthesis protein TsaE